MLPIGHLMPGGIGGRLGGCVGQIPPRSTWEEAWGCLNLCLQLCGFPEPGGQREGGEKREEADL